MKERQEKLTIRIDDAEKPLTSSNLELLEKQKNNFAKLNLNPIKIDEGKRH